MSTAPQDLELGAAFLAVVDRLVDQLSADEARGRGREAWACLREYLLVYADTAVPLLGAWRARGEAMVVLDPVQRLLGAYAVEAELLDLAWRELEDDLAAQREDAEVGRVFGGVPELQGWKLVVNAGDRLVWELGPCEHFSVEGFGLAAYASADPRRRPRARYRRARQPALSPQAVAVWAAALRAEGRQVELGEVDVASWSLGAPAAPPLVQLLLAVPQLAAEASALTALLRGAGASRPASRAARCGG